MMLVNPYRFAQTDSLTFNSTDEYIDFGTDSSLDLEYNDAFSFRVQLQIDTDQSQTILGSTNVATQRRGWQLRTRPSEKIGLLLTNANNLNYKMDITTAANAFTVGTPFELCCTYDGSNLVSGVEFYIDGTLQTGNLTVIDALGARTIANSVLTECGAYSLNGSNYLDGIIKYVAIFDKELTGSEITNTDIESIGNVLLYSEFTKFDPVDISSNGNDGTGVNMDGTNETNI